MFSPLKEGGRGICVLVNAKTGLQRAFVMHVGWREPFCAADLRIFCFSPRGQADVDWL